MANEPFNLWVTTVLAAAAALAGSEQTPVVQGGATVAATIDQIAARTVAAFMLAAQHPGYVAGNWYPPYVGSTGNGVATAANSIRMIPFIPAQSMTVSTLGQRVGTPGISNVQFAIYGADPTTKRATGLPLGTTGSVINTSGGNINSALGANVPLIAGELYWLAMNCGDSVMISIVINSATTTAGYLLGSANQSAVDNNGGLLLAITTPSVFGTWPDLTAATFTELTSAAYAMIVFKVFSIP